MIVIAYKDRENWRYIKFNEDGTYEIDAKEKIKEATLFNSVDELIDFCHERNYKSFADNIEIVEVELVTEYRELRRIS